MTQLCLLLQRKAVNFPEGSYDMGRLHGMTVEQYAELAQQRSRTWSL